MKNLVLTLSVLVSTVSIAQDTVVQIESYPPTHTIFEIDEMNSTEMLSTVFFPIVQTNDIKGLDDYTLGYYYQSKPMTKVLYGSNTYSFYTFNLTRGNLELILNEFINVVSANGIDIYDSASWDERSFTNSEGYDGNFDDYDALYEALQADDEVMIECHIWTELPDGTPVWFGVQIDSWDFEFRCEVNADPDSE